MAKEKVKHVEEVSQFPEHGPLDENGRYIRDENHNGIPDDEEDLES